MRQVGQAAPLGHHCSSSFVILLYNPQWKREIEPATLCVCTRIDLAHEFCFFFLIRYLLFIRIIFNGKSIVGLGPWRYQR